MREYDYFCLSHYTNNITNVWPIKSARTLKQKSRAWSFVQVNASTGRNVAIKKEERDESHPRPTGRGEKKTKRIRQKNPWKNHSARRLKHQTIRQSDLN